MIYTATGKPVRIVGHGAGNDHDLVVVKAVPVDGKIEGLSEFMYFRRELTADGGIEEIREAVRALGERDAREW